MAEFNQEQALKDYTELQRRVSVGAYEERKSEHFETGTYPEDGVEESIDNLTELAARHGLEFWWHKDTSTYTLEPMSEETRAARRVADYNREIDERNAINYANREKPWLPGWE
jgi:hypothetical protein